MNEYPEGGKGIKSWAEDDRPREKLLLKGKAALSDAELVAILLGSGSRHETAVDLGKRILAAADNNLNKLGRFSTEELMNFRGVGEAKAISIITALELGKRRRLTEARAQKKIVSSAHVFELMQPIIGDLGHEEFWAVYLGAANKVITTKCISKGGLTGTLADLRMIFREALMIGTTGIILAHNHPSGSVSPSRPDEVLTKKIKEAGGLMDIKLLDHLIVSEHQYYSFADEGTL